jgi:NAD(P)-dependent dehydrogenase (short-subunit alcohol dehydrogenase family)
MKLKDKVAVVTGAQRGFGKAIALALTKEGATMVTYLICLKISLGLSLISLNH